MNFISIELENLLAYLDKLDAHASPLWGRMTAQHMVEHLSDSVRMSFTPHDWPLAVSEEQVVKMQEFLFSDHPIAKNQPNPAVTDDYVLRNEDIVLAVDEFTEAWISYQEYYQENPQATILHPMFGLLNKKGWDRMHSKHFTHHFTQFGLL